MSVMNWLQSFFGYLILYAVLLAIIAWAVLQGGETASSVVFVILLVGSIFRDALKGSG